MPNKFSAEDLEMERNNQSQSAGDNAQQMQMINPTFIMGIDEKRAREIFVEMSQRAIAENTAEAYEVANQRIEQFENQLLPRIQQIEESFNSFSDPSFQVLLRKAQLTAACTEREDDYKILSELLVHRVKNKANIKKKASISKAMEIVDQIDDDSLLALTVFLAIEHFAPVTGDISRGLDVLDSLYSRFDLDNLPTDTLWMDNLSILGAINTVAFGSLKKFEQFFSEALSGYACAGVKKESEDHAKAIELLKKNGINENILVENELMPEYLRLSIPREGDIDTLRLHYKLPFCGNTIVQTLLITDKQKECLKEIWNMYAMDSDLLSKVKKNFSEKLDSFPSIKKVRIWWDSLQGSIVLTSVGRVIAHTYAKSIDNSLPDID